MLHNPEAKPTDVVDRTGHPMEYVECRYCGRGFYRRVKAITPSCGKLACDLARDREELSRLPKAEQEAYWAASRKYYGELDAKRDQDAGRAPIPGNKGLKKFGGD